MLLILGTTVIYSRCKTTPAILIYDGRMLRIKSKFTSSRLSSLLRLPCLKPVPFVGHDSCERVLHCVVSQH